MTRIAVANNVLCSFAPAYIEKTKTGYYISWNSYKSNIRKRWAVRSGQDFYPTWRFPFGGTSAVALSQLIRWLRNQAVLPITSWYYWSTIGLLKPVYVDYLRLNDYPTIATCVLCQRELNGSLDWWHLNKITGPCCHYYEGCKQKCTQ
jgi:hypothetical protein